MQIFDGNYEAKLLDHKISEKLKFITQPILLIIQIGDNEMSEVYIRSKVKLCEKLNIGVDVVKIPANLEMLQIENRISKLFSGKKYKGGIIQLPLPEERLNYLLNMIPEATDIDNLNEHNNHYKSPILRSFEHFLEKYDLKSRKNKFTIIGLGKLIGKPIAEYLVKLGFEIETYDENIPTENLNYKGKYTQGHKINTDILVLGTNIPNLLEGEDLNKNTHVVDFGTTLVNKKTTGNLDKDSKLDHLGCVSLTPGGMGPLVTRYLLMNLVDL